MDPIVDPAQLFRLVHFVSPSHSRIIWGAGPAVSLRTFGHYTSGRMGTTVSAALSIF
jgi:hypothetical protein